MPPRGKRPSSAELLVQMSMRISALEDRLRKVERRLRFATASKAGTEKKSTQKRSGIYCGGCQLEQPSGPKRKICVWCGFALDLFAGRP